MNKTTKILLSVIVVAGIAAAGFYYFKKGEKVAVGPTPQKSPSVKGCYVAKLAKDVYTLVLETQEAEIVTGKLAFNNYQKDSSSGAFTGTLSGDILQGNYSFDSEGMHSDRQVIFKKVGDNFVEGFGPADVVNGKEVFLDTSKITYDPKSTFVKSEDCTNVFTENNNTFSFSYNPYFLAYESEELAPSTGWSLGSTQNGVVLASVHIPSTFMPYTNFSEMYFTVGRSTTPKAIRNCATNALENQTNMGTTTISGYPFAKSNFIGAAAGNLYDTTSFKGIVDGDCYAIEYTIHSANIGNYSPDQGIKEFDKSKIQSEADRIIKSFKFLISSN